VHLVDITGWIYSGMWRYFPEYPGADLSELPQPAQLAGRDPVFLQKFVLGGQSGTYIENQAHVDRGATPVVDLPLEAFWRPALVISIGWRQPLTPVMAKDLAHAEPDIRPGDAVLLHSGWDAKWHDPDYVEGSPYLSAEAARWLMDREIGLLGSDFPRFDCVERPCFPWPEFWDRVGLLLAPVVNLAPVAGRRATLIAFPLKIAGACATPCRAVLRDEPEGSDASRAG